jgi:hypothetical protein
MRYPSRRSWHGHGGVQLPEPFHGPRLWPMRSVRVGGAVGLAALDVWRPVGPAIARSWAGGGAPRASPASRPARQALQRALGGVRTLVRTKQLLPASPTFSSSPSLPKLPGVPLTRGQGLVALGPTADGVFVQDAVGLQRRGMPLGCGRTRARPAGHRCRAPLGPARATDLAQLTEVDGNSSSSPSCRGSGRSPRAHCVAA